MKLDTLGVMSMGDMGSGVASVLKQNGFNVITSLDNRSKESVIRAKENKITDVGSLRNLVDQSDIILSILVKSHQLRDVLPKPATMTLIWRDDISCTMALCSSPPSMVIITLSFNCS